MLRSRGYEATVRRAQGDGTTSDRLVLPALAVWTIETPEAWQRHLASLVPK